MPVESGADRAMFLSTDDFGVTVSYLSQSSESLTMTGIFDNAHIMVELSGESSVSTVAPALTCRSDDFESLSAGKPRQGDSMTIAATSYMVRDVQPDGTGMITLILERR